MRLIVTHEQPDFDAIAGLALARLAHPGAVPVIEGDVPDNIRSFLNLYRDRIELTPADHIDLTSVTELIVVDTNDPGRLGRFEELAQELPVTLYDHHPHQADELSAAHGIQEQVGSTATLLSRHLQASAIDIPAEIASLALLGIHEDTGNFTFDLTTPDDYLAAAHLRSCGASLQVVREFSTEDTEPEQRELLDEAANRARTVELGGYRVVASAFEFPRYVRNASGVSNTLLSQASADAALLVVRMDGKTLLFARAERGFDVGSALAEAFRGGGHRGAAFARSELDPEDALERALATLPDHMLPVPLARQVMTAPVKTFAPDTPVHEAQLLLTRFGHNGAPVVDEGGRVVGIVSRRDLERALRQDLSRSAVSGFMTREVISASPDSTLLELEQLVEEHDIGRVPIVDDGNLLGIVTRSDLLRAHHAPSQATDAVKVRDRLPGAAHVVVERAQALLAESAQEGALYLVGGTVRDALLGKALLDLDLVIEGMPAEDLVGRLQRRLGGSMSFHASFGTSTLRLPSGLVVDVAAAREEYYPSPGALPEVTPSSIRKDLSRRDFTINAIALRLFPKPLELVDPKDGIGDLRRKLLRTLHPLSFSEDPTRILRGARLAGRLGFEWAPTTREQAREALRRNVAAGVSRSRLRAELELTFSEQRVAPALSVLDSLGAIESIFGLSYGPELIGSLDDQQSSRDVPELSYLLALLLQTEPALAETHVESFHWPRRLIQQRSRLAQARSLDHASQEILDAADAAEIEVLRLLSPALLAQVTNWEQAPHRRRLRGRDVLELGLPPGPTVGAILAEVAEAREQGRVETFEEELELARRQVNERLESGEPE